MFWRGLLVLPNSGVNAFGHGPRTCGSSVLSPSSSFRSAERARPCQSKHLTLVRRRQLSPGPPASIRDDRVYCREAQTELRGDVLSQLRRHSHTVEKILDEQIVTGMEDDCCPDAPRLEPKPCQNE